MTGQRGHLMGLPATGGAAPAYPRAPGVASRIVAYRALRAVHGNGAWSTQAVDRALRGSDLDARDRAFAANLAYETLRWEGTLDWALSRVVNRPLAQVQPEVLDVLRLGAWQLLRGDAPDRSAVATAVDVARAEIAPRVAGFVNGVLRGLAREKATLPWPPVDSDAGLGLATGYPAFVVAEARAAFGDRARAVLDAGNQPPGLTLRAVGDRDGLIAELRREGLPAEPGVAAPEAVRVPGGDPQRLAAVAEGRATPQDEASMLMVHALDRAAGGVEGLRVLDACAAPGGKTTHLAALGASVVANDVHPHRARLVADAARRLRVAERVETTVADATCGPWPAASFDAVLVDAPCTGYGTVRRRPEVRWRRDEHDARRLAALQLQLLEAATGLVRPGGSVLYSACTWTVSETRDVVSGLLAGYGDLLIPVDVATALDGLGTPVAGAPGVQLASDRDGVDGMFVCAFRRRSR